LTKASVEFENMFPAKQPSKVVVRTNDGKEYSAYLEYPKGDAREPMTEEDLDIKFAGLAEGLLPAEKQKKLKETIFNCEKISAREFATATIV